MDYERTLVMACATVIEEMLPLLPEGISSTGARFWSAYPTG